MSFKNSKLDLLIRVRYSNPLPAPPYPPKLLDIPTNPMRYARPEFLDDIASDVPFPMIVDGDFGMPLDLSQWESLWEENGDESELNPNPETVPPLDPKDQFLLLDPASSSSVFPSSQSFNGAGPSTPASSMPHVAWLRKTEYISREGSTRPSPSQDAKHAADQSIDVSRAAQIRNIDASFAALESAPLSALTHPTKPGITAVEAYDVLPDADIWANAYDLFRFAERPGERPPDVEDPRLDCAILRPMESDGDHFLAYYLSKEDETAVEFKRSRLARSPDAPEEDEATPFYFVRDYETVRVEQDVPNEFLLVLDDGDDAAPEDDTKARYGRAKGAYYKNIERKMLLKKKRQAAYESYQDKWDVVKVTHVPMSQDERDERDELLAEVVDPMYLLSRGDADAEGELDEGADAEGEAEVEANGHAEQGEERIEAVDVFGED